MKNEAIYLVLTLGALLWGAVIDYKVRKIPNGVHVLLILAGLFSGLSVVQHVIGLLLPIIVYFVLDAVKTKTAKAPDEHKVGGGDVKLMGALGFNAGVVSLILVLGLSAVIALVFSKDIKKRVPLCSYVFVGQVIMCAATMIIRRA